MKFSDLLGEPEPDDQPASTPEAEPISVFTPVPVAPPEPPAPPVPAAIEDAPTIPAPTVPAPPPPVPAATAPAPAGGRSGLAELNVHQQVAAPRAADDSMIDQLTGLDEVVDDLLPGRRGRK